MPRCTLKEVCQFGFIGRQSGVCFDRESSGRRLGRSDFKLRNIGLGLENLHGKFALKGGKEARADGCLGRECIDGTRCFNSKTDGWLYLEDTFTTEAKATALFNSRKRASAERMSGKSLCIPLCSALPVIPMGGCQEPLRRNGCTGFKVESQLEKHPTRKGD